jgi:molybdopterin molybdotransferase
MISLETAFQLLADSVAPLAPSRVKLAHSVGRVLAENVAADVDSPPHKKSVMDGFAIRSEDVGRGTRKLSVVETIVAGSWPQRSIGPGEAARIMTGAPLPAGADAVVMIEQTNLFSAEGKDCVEIELESISSGKHLLERSTNFAKGDIVLSAGQRIRPTDVGLLAEVGAHQVLVGTPPKTAILPTGDELVRCDQQPDLGQIRNSNGPMLLALANQLGLEVSDLGIGRDNAADLESAVRKGLEHDLFVLSGGVSAGLLDLVPGILKNEGVEEVFHKVKVKPGKPIWFGVCRRDNRNCYVFGLPGNPVSSLVGFQLFVRTAIRRLENCTDSQPPSLTAVLAASHQTRGDRPTYWPGRWCVDDSSVRSVIPIPWHGSSDLLALGSAEGLIYFPGESTDHEAGTEVPFLPF